MEGRTRRVSHRPPPFLWPIFLFIRDNKWIGVDWVYVVDLCQGLLSQGSSRASRGCSTVGFDCLATGRELYLRRSGGGAIDHRGGRFNSRSCSGCHRGRSGSWTAGIRRERRRTNQWGPPFVTSLVQARLVLFRTAQGTGECLAQMEATWTSYPSELSE